MASYQLENICLACGVDLEVGVNWHVFNAKKRLLRCRTCYLGKIPQNEVIAEAAREKVRQQKLIDNPPIIKIVTKNFQKHNEHKYCIDCNVELILDQNWNEGFGVYVCGDCKKERIRKFQKETNYNRLKNLDLKNDLNFNYGGECGCCGEKIWQFLTIDHINNDGYIDKRDNGYNLKQLPKLGYPKDNYQLLCMNCNYSKGHNKFCVHNIKNMGDNCNFCNKQLKKENMFIHDFEGSNAICYDCSISINKRTNSPITRITYTKKREVSKLKQDVFDNYGGSCVCCGENEYYFMTIDHILGGGSSRINKNHLTAGNTFYRWLRNNDYPTDLYQLLCYNCNCSKGHYGQCYHKLAEQQGKDVSIEDYKELIRNNIV